MVKHAAMLHDDADKRANELNAAIQALSDGITAVAVGLPVESQRPFVAHICEAIMHHLDYYNQTKQEMDYEEFLRDKFTPGRFHA